MEDRMHSSYLRLVTYNISQYWMDNLEATTHKAAITAHKHYSVCQLRIFPSFVAPPAVDELNPGATRPEPILWNIYFILFL